MAIDNNSRILAALKLQTNNTPVRGCGGVLVDDGKSLPAGDYTFAHPITASTTALANIVWKGEPIVDDLGAPITTITLDSARGGHTMWAMNIESCDVSDGKILFYHRCK
tara:strand:- start:11828 stop:12154 length:327 start_codon:yes stop_codon:yes gene_type:complete